MMSLNVNSPLVSHDSSGAVMRNLQFLHEDSRGAFLTESRRLIHRYSNLDPTGICSSASLCYISVIFERRKKTKNSETDSIKFKISSKTSRGKKDSTKRHHHRHHKRQPGEQQFPIQVITG